MQSGRPGSFSYKGCVLVAIQLQGRMVYCTFVRCMFTGHSAWQTFTRGGAVPGFQSPSAYVYYIQTWLGVVFLLPTAGLLTRDFG